MIKRWEIRENTVTENSVYILLMEGTEDSANKISSELAAFCHLIDVVIPPFSHVFELYNIVDDSMLEKIRIKIEEISQYVGIEGDINERTKHLDLDVISPETQIFGQSADNEQPKEPTVFMDEPEDDKEPQNISPAPQEPAKQQDVLPKTEPYIVKSPKAPEQKTPAAQKQVTAPAKPAAPAKVFVPPAVKPKIPALKPQLLRPKHPFAAVKPVWGRTVKKQSGAPADAPKPPAVKETHQNKPAVPVQTNTVQKPVIQRPVIQKNVSLQTSVKRPALSRPVIQKTEVQKPSLNSGYTTASKKANPMDLHLDMRSANKTSLGPVPVNNIPDKKELFAPTQVQERKVKPSDIFVQGKSADNKVQLSTGEFSVKMDSGNFGAFDVAADNDMDVGDGTFINLNGAEGTMLKKIDTTEYNIVKEDTGSSDVGIATLIGGKYKDEPADDVNEKAQSLRLMGGLANDIQNPQPSYEQQSLKTGRVELDNNSSSFSIRDDETIQRDVIRQSPAQAQQVAVPPLGSSATNPAAAVPAAQVNPQAAPAVNGGNGKAGGIMEFINKIVALITEKINSFTANKQQQAPLAYVKEITPQDDFNEMLQKEQAKNLEGQPAASSLQPVQQAPESAAVQKANSAVVQTVNPAETGIKVSAPKTESKNPFANLGNVPKEETVIVRKGSQSLKKAVADMNKNNPVTVNGRLPETDSNLSDLSAKIQVDDIFAAETIYESFADKDYDYSAPAVQSFKESGSSADAQSSAQSLGSQADTMTDDMEVPNIFSGSPKKENKAVVTPSPKQQSNTNSGQVKQSAAALGQVSERNTGSVSGNKTVLNKAPAVKKISAVNTVLPKMPSGKPAANNAFKMQNNLGKQPVNAANKTILKPAGIAANKAVSAAQKTILKPLKPVFKPAMPSMPNKILNKKVLPKPVFAKVNGNTVKKI